MNAFTSISKPVENAALRVLSFGAGVQSTVLLLMAAKGEIKPMPDVAIFADTQFEPASIYKHLEWVEMELDYLTDKAIKIEIVKHGNIKQDHINAVNNANDRIATMPLFLDNHGVIWRQCTVDYKIKPIQNKIKEILGLKKGQRVSKNIVVEQWMGISTDELERVKENNKPFIVNRFPLIEMGMSRGDCYQWFKKHYPHKPLVKSACIACPYHNNSMWRDMKKNDPVSWEEACQFDDDLRKGKSFYKLKQNPFVHNSATPLRTADLGDEHTPDLFLGECDGMCGV